MINNSKIAYDYTSRAFTLVELAIVIVIIGLLIGGVLQGKELIDISKRQRVVKEVNQLYSAVNTFRSKYNGLPGDITNGLTYFSTTGNGNGDGYIDGAGTEELWAAVQLKAANLVSLSHTTGSYGIFLSSVYSNLSYFYDVPCSVSGPCWPYGIQRGKNGITISKNPSTAAIFTPIEAQWIDSKMDNGVASNGTMFGSTASASLTTCTSTIAGVVDYNLSNDDISCVMYYNY